MHFNVLYWSLESIVLDSRGSLLCTILEYIKLLGGKQRIFFYLGLPDRCSNVKISSLKSIYLYRMLSEL